MKIIQIAHQSRTQMMGYLLVAPDGTLSVIDGGMYSEAPYLLALLREYSGEDRPRVRYWFLTHAHFDHCGAFLSLYGHLGIHLDVDELVYTFPSSQEMARCGVNRWIETAERFEALQIPHTEPRPGDVYDLGGGARMVTLLTFDPSVHRNYINNASTVWRLESDGVSVLFLGDLGVEGGERLLAACPPEAIRCDAVQMAHHGQQGVGRAVYEAAKPSVCLWNAPDWLFTNTQDPLRPGKGPWKTLETRAWMEEIAPGARHVVTKDGTWLLTLRDGEIGCERLSRRTGETE